MPNVISKPTNLALRDYTKNERGARIRQSIHWYKVNTKTTKKLYRSDRLTCNVRLRASRLVCPRACRRRLLASRLHLLSCSKAALTSALIRSGSNLRNCEPSGPARISRISRQGHRGHRLPHRARRRARRKQAASIQIPNIQTPASAWKPFRHGGCGPIRAPASP